MEGMNVKLFSAAVSCINCSVFTPLQLFSINGLQADDTTVGVSRECLSKYNHLCFVPLLRFFLYDIICLYSKYHGKRQAGKGHYSEEV